MKQVCNKKETAKILW